MKPRIGGKTLERLRKRRGGDANNGPEQIGGKLSKTGGKVATVVLPQSSKKKRKWRWGEEGGPEKLRKKEKVEKKNPRRIGRGIGKHTERDFRIQRAQKNRGNEKNGNGKKGGEN